MDQNSYVIVHADKTVLKIAGLTVKGLDTRSLEALLSEKLKSTVRVIGVTGTSIDMDVYGLDPEAVLKDPSGLIQAVALCDGITAGEVTRLSQAERIVPVDFDQIPDKPVSACAKERWITGR
ncbi:hypothetical protein [Anaerolentibacter hominis]|uniref:hypothetical protein n=1 Tax=Anaerolentibacter hominis TaxID=3079009 RepID=UPI0031B84D25